MSGLISVIFSCVFIHSVYGLTDTDFACIQKFNQELSNDFLLGDWFFVYKWAGWANLPPSISCLNVTFSQPTAEDILKFMGHYNDYSNFNITQNPIMTVSDIYRGVTVGYNEVKFFVLSPDDHMILRPNGYKAEAYRKINDEYVLYVNCNLRFQEFWLLSRHKHPNVEELNKVIAGIEEVKRMETQRYCAES